MPELMISLTVQEFKDVFAAVQGTLSVLSYDGPNAPQVNQEEHAATVARYQALLAKLSDVFAASNSVQ